MGCSAVLFLAVVLGQRLLIQLLNHQSLPSRKYISHTRSLSPALSTAHSLELPTERHPGLLQKSHEVRITQGLTWMCAWTHYLVSVQTQGLGQDTPNLMYTTWTHTRIVILPMQ